jgi:hypothetical protein
MAPQNAASGTVLGMVVVVSDTYEQHPAAHEIMKGANCGRRAASMQDES